MYIHESCTLYLFIPVEGVWGSWDPWGTCTGLCDIHAIQNRTRNFTGGTIPCNGTAEETTSCQGEEIDPGFIEVHCILY